MRVGNKGAHTCIYLCSTQCTQSDRQASDATKTNVIFWRDILLCKLWLCRFPFVIEMLLNLIARCVCFGTIFQCARVYFGCPKTPCLHVHMQMPIQFALHSASAISLSSRGFENAIVTIYHLRSRPSCSCH